MKESPSLPRNALYRGHSPCILIWELPLEVFPLPSKVRPFPAPLHHITHPSCPLMNHRIVLSPQTPGQEHPALNPVSRPHSSPASSSSSFWQTAPLSLPHTSRTCFPSLSRSSWTVLSFSPAPKGWDSPNPCF